MSNRIELDVRSQSDYGKATEFMRKTQVYTRSMLMDFFKGLGKSEAAARGSMEIMLSPRLTSKGDCRGNISNPWGHLAYNEKLARQINSETGEKSEQKFRFRFRDLPLVRRTRPRNLHTLQEKTATSTPEMATSTKKGRATKAKSQNTVEV